MSGGVDLLVEEDEEEALGCDRCDDEVTFRDWLASWRR